MGPEIKRLGARAGRRYRYRIFRTALIFDNSMVFFLSRFVVTASENQLLSFEGKIHLSRNPAVKAASGMPVSGFASQNRREARYRSREAWFLKLARKVRESEMGLAVIGRTFRLFQKLGLSVSPNHFYWPVPDLKELSQRDWPADALPAGLDLAIDRQLEFLQNVVPQYEAEWLPDKGALFSAGYSYGNGFFETVDAEIAYCLARHLKPRQIVEVGGGYSSRAMVAALDMNAKSDESAGELITIDPDPQLPGKVLSHSSYLIAEPIQNVDASVFRSLQSGDFLFLDSSHVVGVGSDVVKEYLEILPKLAPGVVIHAHDIFIPSDYPREVVLKNLTFWSEQYLLQALLMFNPHFEVLWASSAMQSYASDALDAAFPRWKASYREMPRAKRRFLPTRDGQRVWPSSFWIRKVG